MMPREIYQNIDEIVTDPEHPLPEGITALIRNAVFHNGRIISGTIWYDKNKRFPDGYMINSSPIASKAPGGIYTTKSGAKYLVEFVTAEDYEIEVGEK